jgi:hypothetical protein
MLITGAESIENIMKMPAVASMIVNGDLARQLADEPLDRQISHIEAYQDSENRSRMRVIWT